MYINVAPDLILTLTVAARNLFRKQDDFNDAVLSLEQICPGWVPWMENKMKYKAAGKM